MLNTIESFTVIASFGQFRIEKYQRGIKLFSIDGYLLMLIPSIPWWDKDKIIQTIENNRIRLERKYLYQKSIRE